MPQPIYQVDAFTARPFHGNPAGVCPLDGAGDWPESAWMQEVAAEMNVSETAFLLSRADGSFGLRWFTPAVEVDLCGHASLAAAHVLWDTGRLDAEAVAHFQSRSGLLTATPKPGGWIELDFPVLPPAPTEPPSGLADALCVTPTWVGRSRHDLLVRVADEAAVRALRPDVRLLCAVPTRGTIVTAPSSDPAFDFVSRFFAPAVGVDEDPVTGSAHCVLTPYWAAELGKQRMTAYQASPRGGVLRVALAADRVKLSGQAVTVLQGELLG